MGKDFSFVSLFCFCFQFSVCNISSLFFCLFVCMHDLFSETWCFLPKCAQLMCISFVISQLKFIAKNKYAKKRIKEYYQPDASLTTLKKKFNLKRIFNGKLSCLTIQLPILAHLFKQGKHQFSVFHFYQYVYLKYLKDIGGIPLLRFHLGEKGRDPLKYQHLQTGGGGSLQCKQRLHINYLTEHLVHKLLRKITRFLVSFINIPVLFKKCFK